MATLTLEGFTDAAPCPRVGITIEGVTGTQSVSVWRTAAGQRLLVRGLSGRMVSTADYVVDHEVPLSRTVTYELYVAGVLNDTETITVSSPTAWLQDPLSPTQATPLVLSAGAGPGISPGQARSFTTRVAAQVVTVLGSKMPVALGGVRMAPAGVPFGLYADSENAASTVRSVLDNAFLVLLRSLPQMSPFDPIAFLLIQEVTELPVDTHLGGSWTEFQMTADVVAGPAVSVVVPVWSYAEVNALWTTYDTTKGGTYLDWLRDPTP